MTIILSGPAATAAQAQNALVRAGFPLLDGEAGTDPHGLPPTVTGGDPAEPQAFAAVTGSDVNAAGAAVAPYGWVLRAARPT